MADHDAIVVGSGINGLACAALRAKGGWNVCVLERNDWFGGAIKTAEVTVPGFHHDVFSAWHPLWVGGPAHAQLGADLARHGLEYLNTELPTGTLYPDGGSAFLLRSAEENVAALGEIQQGCYDRALAYRKEHTRAIGFKDEFIAFFTPKNAQKPEIHGGFAVSPWCGSADCEAWAKDELKVTIRVIPMDDLESGGFTSCIVCGRPKAETAVFAKAY